MSIAVAYRTDRPTLQQQIGSGPPAPEVPVEPFERSDWLSAVKSVPWELSDVEGLIGGFLKPQAPKTYVIGDPRRPLIRFWADDLEGNGLRLIQGTARIRDISVKQTGHIIEYTVTADMYQPVEQYWIPDEAVMPDGVDSKIKAKETACDVIQAEADTGEGFKLLGYIAENDLEIKNEIHVDDWGHGRSVKTREDISVSFSTVEIGPAFEKLFRP